MSKPLIIIQTPLVKRKWFIALIAAASIAAGFLVWQLVQTTGDDRIPEDERVAASSDGNLLEPTTLFLEYSDKTIDPLKLVTCNDASATLSTDDALDLSTVGVQSVTYRVSCNGNTSSSRVDFTVRDTRGPSIAFIDDEPAIEQGGTFDPLANIKHVADDVDGELVYRAIGPDTSGSEAGLELFYDQGWFTIEGEVYSDTPGTYTLKVKALDKHGNAKARDMKVRVNAAASIEAVTAQPATHAYVLNKRSKVFHLPSCHSAHEIVEKNRWDVEMTRDEVLAMEYRPCLNCNP